MNHIKEIKIGGVICKTNLFLAPMAGITDTPFGASHASGMMPLSMQSTS